MNVGVYARYQPCDITYAALQVADLARCCGNQVSVYTITPARPAVHARWDGRVVRDVKFTDWAESLDLIVWVECPLADQVRWCRRPKDGTGLAPGEPSLGRRLVLVSVWDDTPRQIREVYPLFHHVVAPSQAAADYLLDAAGLKNVRSIPWSPRLPITIHPDLGPMARPRLHFPLCDAQGRGADPTVIDLIERLLRAEAEVDIRVSLQGRSGEVVRRLERRAKQYPSLAIARCGDFESFALRLGGHDLTVLASTAECFGMTALCSLHAGVPVLAFSAPPLDEFVEPGRSGILIPGRDPTRFEAALTSLVGRPDQLARLRSTCAEGLTERAHDFEQAWGTILFEA